MIINSSYAVCKAVPIFNSEKDILYINVFHVCVLIQTLAPMIVINGVNVVLLAF